MVSARMARLTLQAAAIECLRQLEPPLAEAVETRISDGELEMVCVPRPAGDHTPAAAGAGLLPFFLSSMERQVVLALADGRTAKGGTLGKVTGNADPHGDASTNRLAEPDGE